MNVQQVLQIEWSVPINIGKVIDEFDSNGVRGREK